MVLSEAAAAGTAAPASRPSSRAGARPVPAGDERYTLSQARRIALRAQGLDRPRPARRGPATMRHLRQVVDQVGLLQIDSVNIAARAHLMPVFSRIGPYDTRLIDRAASTPPRSLVESWAHQASFVPPETFRLLEWRRNAYRTEAWGTIADVPLQHSAVVEEVLDLLRENGPMTASAVHAYLEERHPATRTEWGWNWTVAKRVLEYLFFTGQATAASRNSAFERLYDLTERVLPPELAALPLPDDAEAVRELVEISARAHGIGTLRCFADYFRIKTARVAPAVADLVDAGVLVPATVTGWERPVFRHVDATLPRTATGAALLSPFDPLVFERRRLEELFGLRYRIEIYTPAPKRVWGYYVLPFLLGEELVALVDLKADRQAGVLRVLSTHDVPAAPGSDARRRPGPDDVVRALAGELRLMADWLGLDEVEVVHERTDEAAPALAPGALAPALHAAVRAA